MHTYDAIGARGYTTAVMVHLAGFDTLDESTIQRHKHRLGRAHRRAVVGRLLVSPWQRGPNVTCSKGRNPRHRPPMSLIECTQDLHCISVAVVSSLCLPCDFCPKRHHSCIKAFSARLVGDASRLVPFYIRFFKSSNQLCLGLDHALVCRGHFLHSNLLSTKVR